MTEPITYTLNVGLSKFNMALTDERFTSRGSMQNVDIPLASLRNFCVVPVKTDLGTYDSQLVISWSEAGKTQAKKLCVRNTDASFQQFVQALQQKRPDASLLHLDPKVAQKQMGVLSTNKLAWIIGLAIVGLVLLIGLVGAILSASQS